MLKKVIITILILLVVIGLCIGGYFAYSYLTAPTDLKVYLNEKEFTLGNTDLQTYSTDLYINWDNQNFKVTCNGYEILPNTLLNESGTYQIIFAFKKVSHEINIEIDKSLTFTLQDYDGNEIHNYTTNTKPFMVISEDSSLKINNLSQDLSYGFYEAGDYKFTSKNFDTRIIKLNGIQSPNEYHFYITSAMLPTLYMALDLSKTALPSYVWYTETDLLNQEVLSQNENITLLPYIGQANKLTTDVVTQIQTTIQEILNNDSNAYFHLYTDDTFHWLEYPIFAELGLEDARYDITYYSDGYTNYIHLNGYPYSGEDGYKQFLEVQQEQLKLLHEVRSNKYHHETNQYLLGYLPDKYDYKNEYIFPSSSRENVSYVLLYPELIQFQDTKITEVILDDHFIKASPQDLYEELTTDQKETFLNITYFSQEEFDNTYFSEGNKTPYLIITGTSSLDENIGIETFESYIKLIYQTYKEDYQLLYQPPSFAKLDKTYQEILEKYDITILPEDLPIEMIPIIYENVYFGGFSNSLYLTIPNQKVLFFFMEEDEELISPLDILFEDTSLIYPKNITEETLPIDKQS